MPSIGFGLERLGLPAIRHPVIALTLIAIFSAVCAVGVTRIKVEQSLSELFRADTPEFAIYQRLSKHFPTSEFDVMVVVEGDNLIDPERLETVRTLHLDLELAEAVEGVISMFSMRDPPVGDEAPEATLPAELPEGEAFDELIERVVGHPLIGGKMLSKPGDGNQITLLILSLRPDVPRDQGLFEPLREIEEIARETLEGTGLKFQLAGVPVMQVEIDKAMLRDRLLFNSAGFVVGLLICLAFFRRPKLVIVTSICPALAILWAVGLIGWLDLKLNTFINVIPPLVMVITFTDSMHMVFSIRRRLKEGLDRASAARRAVLNIGPACVLTSITTSIAFLSLTLADSGLIRTFGFSAALATMLAFVSVIVVLPALLVLIFRDESEFLRTEVRRHHAITRLEDLATGLAGWLRHGYLGFAAGGLILLVVFTALHLQLEPRFRLSDQVPDTRQSVSAAERIDVKLTGAHPVHIMLRWQEGKDVASDEVSGVIRQAHEVLEAQKGVGNVWSVETLRRWFAYEGEAGGENLRSYLDKLPKHLLRRFVNEDAHSALVTGRLPDLDSEDAVPILHNLDKSLESLREQHPGFEMTVAGLSAVSALRSSSMIGQLNRGLLAAILVVIVLIGAAFRSITMAAFSVLPNLLPIVAAGTALYLLGGGLEYASVIALTVAFGIAVDDTIHFLSRLRVEAARNARPDAVVRRTVSRIGPVLVLTTLVLVAGLAVTLLSELPNMRLFGALFMTTLTAALAADLLILPSLILAVQWLPLGAWEPPPLTGKALRKLLTGRTLALPTAWGFEVPVTYHADGTMQGEVQGFVAAGAAGSPQIDTGRWWISNDCLCQCWNHWLNGKPYCYELRRRGKVVSWHRHDGQTGTARLGP